MTKPSQVIITAMKRNQRFVGSTSSSQQNEFQSEVIRDLGVFQQEWNNKIVPLMSVLPDGSVDPSIDAFRNGLDGNTLFVSNSATALISNGIYYNSSKARPNTIFEQFVNSYTYINDQVAALTALIGDETSGLTAEEKSKIGSNIFNTLETSSVTSLDGRVNIQSNYVLQLARDMYGSASPTLSSAGTAQLTNSIAAMLDALLELHGGNYHDSVSLSHAAITSASDIVTGTMNQTRIGNSSTSTTGSSDSFVGSPSNLPEDLNQIRTILKAIKGSTAYTTAVPVSANWSGVSVQPTSLLNITEQKGSGTRTNTNPWGMTLNDIENLPGVASGIRLFTGQTSAEDSFPAYANVYNFINGDDLVTAIGGLAFGLTSIDSSVGLLQSDYADSLIDISSVTTASGVLTQNTNHQFERINTTSTSVTLELPVPTFFGSTVIVKWTTGTYAAAVAPASGDLIDDSTSPIIFSAVGQSLTFLYAEAGKWYLI